ncbi:MAG: DUF4203 domain-containing protein [Aggregatilineales bacterium]
MSNLTLFSAIIFIIFGVVNTFFGWRLVRLLIAAWGFVIGGSIGLALAANSGTAVILLAIGAGGLIGIVLSYVLYLVGLFSMGASFGAGLLTVLPVFLALNPDPIFVIIAALIGGIIAVALQRPIVIIYTAFSGAAFIVIGGLLFVPDAISVSVSEETRLAFRTLSSNFEVNPDLNNTAIAVWVVIGIIGALVQFRTTQDME